MPNEDAETLFKFGVVQAGPSWRLARTYTLHRPEKGHEIWPRMCSSRSGGRCRSSRAGRAPPAGCFRVALNAAVAWHRKDAAGTPASDRASTAGPAGPGRSPSRPRTAASSSGLRGIRGCPGRGRMVLLHLDGLATAGWPRSSAISEGNMGVKLDRAKETLGELSRRTRMGPDPFQEAWQSQSLPAVDTDR